MPPETPELKPETPLVALTGNDPAARNPDGSMKDNLSHPKEPESPKPGETKSTDPLKPEQKAPEGEKKPEEAKKPEDLKAALLAGAPEKYEFKSLPEGMEVTEKALAFFKENQMSQAQADQAIAFYSDLVKEATAAPAKAWEKTNADWISVVENDPEYKGDLTAVKATISKFIDGISTFGSDGAAVAKQFREAMDFTGAGNNPAFVKFMYRMGQSFNEGSFVKAGNPSPHGMVPGGKAERPGAAKALYPNLS